MSINTSKGEHCFYKTSGRGVVYAVTEDKSLIHLLAVVQPDVSSSDLQFQVQSALERLDSVLEKENMTGNIVEQSIFVRHLKDKKRIQDLMRAHFGINLPVNTYIPQTPCEDECLFLLEAKGVKKQDPAVEIIRCNENAVVMKYANLSFLLLGDIIPDDPTQTLSYPRSYRGFEMMREQLEQQGFSMADILRTWLYQGHIVLAEGSSQRYKELNHARSDFFEGTEFLQSLLPDIPHGTIYPASTGIGADDMDVTMACIAIKTNRNEVIAVPLENPVQTPAFDYGTVYSPKSPKFSRAMALSYDDTCTVFISGTASITESETVFIGDPEGQTNQTLDNIAELFTTSNLSRHGIEGFGGELSDMISARVYVKRPEYYEKIRMICEQRLGGTPMVFTYADVCRDDLLVEIEGIASCRPIHQRN